jgi:hypothetical protein
MWRSEVWVQKFLDAGGEIIGSIHIWGKSDGLFSRSALWRKPEEKDRFLYPTTFKTIWGALLNTPPYLGVVETRKIEQISEFSPERLTYPQFLATYPQGEYFWTTRGA